MIIVTCDKESEYQWIRAVLASGELNCGCGPIDDLNSCLDMPLIPYKQTIKFRQSDSYENDLEGHIKETVEFKN